MSEISKIILADNEFTIKDETARKTLEGSKSMGDIKVASIESKNIFEGEAQGVSLGVNSNFEDKTYVLNGQMTTTYFNITKLFKKEIKPETYTLSISNPLPFDLILYTMGDSRKDVEILTGSTSKTFTITSSIKEFYLWGRSTSALTLDNLSFKIQLEVGDKATEIVPHIEYVSKEYVDNLINALREEFQNQ